MTEPDISLERQLIGDLLNITETLGDQDNELVDKINEIVGGITTMKDAMVEMARTIDTIGRTLDEHTDVIVDLMRRSTMTERRISAVSKAKPKRVPLEPVCMIPDCGCDGRAHP